MVNTIIFYHFPLKDLLSLCALNSRYELGPLGLFELGDMAHNTLEPWENYSALCKCRSYFRNSEGLDKEMTPFHLPAFHGALHEAPAPAFGTTKH